MPITSSAKKALRQAKTRHGRNIHKKQDYKKAVTTYRKLIVGKKIQEAAKMLSTVYKTLDKASKTNVITNNKASRLKGRLAKMIRKIEG